jgi:hypothetical protein
VLSPIHSKCPQPKPSRTGYLERARTTNQCQTPRPDRENTTSIHLCFIFLKRDTHETCMLNTQPTNQPESSAGAMSLSSSCRLYALAAPAQRSALKEARTIDRPGHGTHSVARSNYLPTYLYVLLCRRVPREVSSTTRTCVYTMHAWHIGTRLAS